MSIANESLAKRYAVAFYRAFHTATVAGDIKHLKLLLDFFTSHKHILVALCNTAYNKPDVQQALALIIQRFQLSPSAARLIKTLTERSQMCLLSGIIRHLHRLYDEQDGKVVYTVSSSHPLQDDQKKIILRFIQQANPNSTVVTHFKLAPELISGLRITSNELLWERSIRKVFSHLKHRLVART